MKKSKAAMLVAGALVLGLTMGTLGIATAAPAQTAKATTGLGLKLGATMRQAGATLADVVAKVTGQPVADVRAARTAGASFAAIAAKKGVSADTVVGDTLTARKAILDQSVKSGRVTQAQADTALTRMKTRLTDRVNATGATTCDGNGGGCGAGGGCGMGGGRGAGGGCNGGGCGAAASGQ